MHIALIKGCAQRVDLVAGTSARNSFTHPIERGLKLGHAALRSECLSIVTRSRRANLGAAVKIRGAVPLGHAGARRTRKYPRLRHGRVEGT